MLLSLIIPEVKKAQSFAGRVAGAAEYAALAQSTNMFLPAAYVVPLEDNAEENRASSGYNQIVRDKFGVIVVVSNVADERGQTAYDAVDQLRTELWAALLGYEVSNDYDRIVYEGATLLRVDRYRLDYQFEFSAEFTICESMTRQGADLAALPPLKTVHIDIDFMTPDDEIEHTLKVENLDA